MSHYPPRLVFLGSVVLLAVQVGCAAHADFVQLRREVRTAHKAQTDSQKQAQEQRDALEQRLEALEVARESGDLRQRFDRLAAKLQNVEERLTIFEKRAERADVPSRGAADAREPDFPSLYKPSDQPAVIYEEPIPDTLSGITPTAAFNLAYNDYLNGRYDLAIVGFQRFLKDFPSTSLAPRAQYWLGDSYYQKKDYVRAMQSFERVVSQYPGDEKVPAALYKIGLASAETGDKPKARGYLKQVIEEYATSNEARLAKNKLAEIR